MTTDQAYVYILANGYKRLYIGMTAKLSERIREHQQHLHPQSFTARYNITQLVYVKQHLSIVQAIAREKQLKGWLRIRKIQLIVSVNPAWHDLSIDLLTPSTFEESKLKPPHSFSSRRRASLSPPS